MTTAARIARHQAQQQPARRDLIGHLLLTGIEHTDARPWIGAVGLMLCIVLAGVLEQWL